MNITNYQLLKKFEGTLLGRMFILKIVKAKPPNVEMARWIELIFGLHERDIIQFKTNRKFEIPGDCFYKPAPMVRLAGFRIPRMVPQSQRVWVRFDLKYPNVIDFEAPIAHGNEPRLFQLTRYQWDHVKMWLDPVHKDDKKFHALDCQTNHIRRSK